MCFDLEGEVLFTAGDTNFKAYNLEFEGSTKLIDQFDSSPKNIVDLNVLESSLFALSFNGAFVRLDYCNLDDINTDPTNDD